MKYLNPRIGYIITSDGYILDELCRILYTFPQNTDRYLISLKTLGSPLDFKIKFCGFKQCLAAQYVFVMTGNPVG